MSFSLQPPLPSVGDFCRQMLLTTKKQLSYEDEYQEAYDENCRLYLELLKDLCDVIAERFGMQREEVLQQVNDFAARENFDINNFFTFPDTPSSSGLSLRTSGVLSDPAKSRGSEHSRTTKRKRTPTMCPITPESQSENNRQPSDLADHQDPIEAFFNRHSALDAASAAICVIVLRSTGTLDSLKKLQEVLRFCRGGRALMCFNAEASCTQIWNFLQTSKAMTYTKVCLRRLYLLQLVARHTELFRVCKAEKHQSSIRGYGSTRTRALDMMMRETFGGQYSLSSEECDGDRGQLNNYLTAGRKWGRLVSKYGKVVVMLVVTGEGTGVNSQDIEHLRYNQLEALLQGFRNFRHKRLERMGNVLEEYVMDVLQGRSPNYCPKFVRLDLRSIQSPDLEDEELLELCEAETVLQEE